MDPISPASSVAASPSLVTSATFSSDTHTVTSTANDSPLPKSSAPESSTPNATASSSPAVKVENSAYLLEEPKLREVMLSDVGIESLLARLKSSYQTATNIAHYIKKRASVEHDRIQDLKRLSKSTHESIRRSDYRQGTFMRQFDEALTFDERLFDSSQAFVTALQAMNDELTELSKASHKSRKSLKESCLRNEKNVVDAENNADKAKSRYYGLCDDMEKLKDPTKTKFFKSKNTQQQEQELQTKINTAEQEYFSKVETVKKLRKELVHTLRPQSIKDLKNLILECDSGVSYQLQKLATLNETLLLQQGFIVCPIKPAGSVTAPLSLKEVMAKIDNELDFYNDILKIKSTKTLNRPETKFVKHPYMIAFDKVPTSVSSNTNTNPSRNNATSAPTSQFNALKPPSQQPSAIKTAASVTPSPAPNSHIKSTSVSSHQRNPSSMLYPDEPATSSPHMQPPNTAGPSKSAGVLPYPDSPPKVNEPLHDQNMYGNPRSQSPDNQNYESSVPKPLPAPTVNESVQSLSISVPAQPAGPYVPTFGSSLDQLIEFENLPVATPIPRVVSKCVGAITRFGMSIEGIYRQAGNPDQIETLRRMFDEASESVDLLHPQNYGISDIHAVSGVLKFYFQELPDPLLTRTLHSQFIQAANIKSDNSRREAIHEVVNDLPDANYSVLKFMALHLYRVAQHEAQNRMSVSTLGNMWGPVFMVSETEDINEVALQGRVVETILFFCDEIFEYTPDFYECVGSDL